MTIGSPSTPEEWEQFRFPPRAARPSEASDSESDDDNQGGDQGESGGSGSGGGVSLEPELLKEWSYCEETGFLRNEGLRKKIDLAHLDEAQKIIRLLAVFELRPDLAFSSLREALETASQTRFGMTLETLLIASARGATIPWKDPGRTPRVGPIPG